MSRLPLLLALNVAITTFAAASPALAQTMTTDAPPASPPQTTPITPAPSPPPTDTTTMSTEPATMPAPAPVPAATPPTTVSTTTTTQATYVPSTDRIVEEERTDRPNKRLLVTGASIFVLSYVPAVIVGAQSDRDADKRLYIPGVGPWLDLAQRNCDANPCANEGVAKAFIIASGAAQGIGVIAALSSLVIPERERVQVRQSAKLEPELHVVPLSFGGGGGVGAIGRF